MKRGLCALAVLVWLTAVPAALAAPQALAPQDLFGPGPHLAGADVVWTQQHRDVARFFVRPVRGGPVAELGAIGAKFGVDFAGGRGSLGVVLGKGSKRRARLTSLPTGLFAGTVALANTLGRPRVFSSSVGPVIIEGAGRPVVVLHPPRAAPRRIALPPGADPTRIAVAGERLAVPILSRGLLRQVVVLALPAGTVVRTIGAKPGAGLETEAIDIGLGADGSVALTVQGGGGEDALLSAGPSASVLELGTVKDEFGLVAPEGGRIAMVQPAGGGGERVVVLDSAREGRIVFRGPPTASVRSLSYDGSHVAWSTDSCQYVSEALSSASQDRDPAGPCIRTEVKLTDFVPPKLRRTRRGLQLAEEVDCLAGPGGRCRLRLAVRENGARVLGRRSTALRVGPSRLVWIPVRRAPRAKSLTEVEVTRVDPGGKTFREPF